MTVKESADESGEESAEKSAEESWDESAEESTEESAEEYGEEYLHHLFVGRNSGTSSSSWSRHSTESRVSDSLRKFEFNSISTCHKAQNEVRDQNQKPTKSQVLNLNLKSPQLIELPTQMTAMQMSQEPEPRLR
ncbi:uncharacterized protein LOC117187076 [Drosophila miranda]|uniref:uncharacterized protein LOC117187076 n=1 Tax=Drosophila miranda TaxID=7229 RepID=UPI00143F89D4|nr:uncharacterized protein LOC117187076 [Drosophila miranda]